MTNVDDIFVAGTEGVNRPTVEYVFEGGDTKTSHEGTKKEQPKDSKLPSWLQSRFK